jgi:hypothetical protein
MGHVGISPDNLYSRECNAQEVHSTLQSGCARSNRHVRCARHTLP